MKAFIVIASGDVQGVGFTRAVQREARKLAIVGHIKNRRDGAVEILAQGEGEKLELRRSWKSLLNREKILKKP